MTATSSPKATQRAVFVESKVGLQPGSGISSRAGADVFLTPRVLDMRVYDELADALRSLVAKAREEGERLKEAAEETGNLGKHAQEVRVEVDDRLKLAARGIASLDDRLDRLGSVVEHAERLASDAEDLEHKLVAKVQEQIKASEDRMSMLAQDSEKLIADQIRTAEACMSKHAEKAERQITARVEAAEHRLAARVEAAEHQATTNIEQIEARAAESFVQAETHIASGLEDADREIKAQAWAALGKIEEASSEASEVVRAAVGVDVLKESARHVQRLKKSADSLRGGGVMDRLADLCDRAEAALGSGQDDNPSLPQATEKAEALLARTERSGLLMVEIRDEATKAVERMERALDRDKSRLEELFKRHESLTRKLAQSEKVVR